jgi:site-specific recombinase XerD
MPANVFHGYFMDFMERYCMPDLSKIGERDRLRARKGDEPHWQRLRFGCFLGYRPSKRGGKGTWFTRAYDPDTAKYSRKALGDYGELTGHEVFAQAKRDAEAWAECVETGGVQTRKMLTVADACDAYAEEKPEAKGILQRTVHDDPIAKVKLDKLRRHHLRDWRKRLEETPALVSRNKGGEKRTKARSKSTVNRDMVPLRAALGRVLSPGTPNTDAAWQEALRPHKGADKRRDLYLDRAERTRLLEETDAEAAPFLRALCLLPLRPGALASLLAKDFESRTRTLTIGKDKHGQPRQVTVPQVIGEFLAAQVKNKLPSAPLFMRKDGRAWNKDAWKHPIKQAVHAAKLPSGAAAYTLRHSVITDLVRGGLPVLTVAQLSGTSVAMIERHYGHLVRNDAEQALARLAL